MSEHAKWIKAVTPANVLKWTGVIFLVTLMVLFVVTVVLSMVRVFA